MRIRLVLPLLLSSAALFGSEAEPTRTEFRLLATSKTSTMEKEMNDAASGGYTFSAVMGGETAFGGKETVVVMGRAEKGAPKRYKLLAATKTSTLEKELNHAGKEGFVVKGVTVFDSSFGGREVAVILESPTESTQVWSYRVLGANRTSTMDKELNQAGSDGFQLMGMCVGKTALGGSEVISIMARAEQR